MAEKTIVAPEIMMEVRKAACVQGVERERMERAEPYQQKLAPLIEQYNGMIKEIESSIDSRIKELENEYAQIQREAKAESEKYNAKRKEVWEEVESLDKQVAQAEEDDRKLQGRLLATPKKKKESAERLEELKERARKARENAEKYYKDESEVRYSVESIRRRDELIKLLCLRTGAGELKETLLNELKYLKLGESAKYLEQLFPDLMKKLVSLGTEITSVRKEWSNAVAHRDVNFKRIKLQAASNPDEHMQEADLIELEYQAAQSGTVLSRSNAVHVTENGQIDWSLKENMWALCDNYVVEEGLLMAPESIGTLPVEAAVHVMGRYGLEKKFANVLTKEAYMALSEESKKTYPTFEAWREACLKSFKSKAKEVELYSRAKESAWEEYASMARARFSTDEEDRKRRVTGYPGSELYKLIEEERRNPEAKGKSNYEITVEVKKRWRATVMAKKKALELIELGDGKTQETVESGADQLGEE